MVPAQSTIAVSAPLNYVPRFSIMRVWQVMTLCASARHRSNTAAFWGRADTVGIGSTRMTRSRLPTVSQTREAELFQQHASVGMY